MEPDGPTLPVVRIVLRRLQPVVRGGTPNPRCPSAPVTAEVPLRCMPTTSSHGPSGMVGLDAGAERGHGSVVTARLSPVDRRPA